MKMSSLSLKLVVTVSIITLTFVILPSFPKARKILSAPLVLNEANARGEACYVLAGGGSLRERLDAAADLMQMGQVPRLILMADNARGIRTASKQKAHGRELNGRLITWSGGEFRKKK